MSNKELSDFQRDNPGFIFQADNLIPALTKDFSGKQPSIVIYC